MNSPADSVDTLPMVMVVGVTPTVLVKADAGIGARPAPADGVVDPDGAAVVVDALPVDEQAASVPPATASTASTVALRRRTPSGHATARNG